MSPIDLAIKRIQNAHDLSSSVLRPILMELIKDMYCEGIKVGTDLSHTATMKIIAEAQHNSLGGLDAEEQADILSKMTQVDGQ